NLLNGTGYLLFSSILNIGDWAVVIEGGRPHWLWRTIMGVVGIAAYARLVSLSATTLGGFVRSGQLALGDVRRLVIVAYIAGGLLLVAGAARNSIDPSLVLPSGIGRGHGGRIRRGWRVRIRAPDHVREARRDGSAARRGGVRAQPCRQGLFGIGRGHASP